MTASSRNKSATLLWWMSNFLDFLVVVNAGCWMIFVMSRLTTESSFTGVPIRTWSPFATVLAQEAVVKTVRQLINTPTHFQGFGKLDILITCKRNFVLFKVKFLLIDFYVISNAYVSSILITVGVGYYGTVELWLAKNDATAHFKV